MIEPGTIAAKALSAAASKAAIAAFRSQFRRRGSEYAERFAAADVERELDEALQLLAHDSRTLPDWITKSLKALISERPVSFADANARLFIADDTVTRLAKQAIRKTLLGEEIEAETREAQSIYEALFEPGSLYGLRLFEDAVAFGAKSVVAALGVQDRVLLDLLGGELSALKRLIIDHSGKPDPSAVAFVPGKVFNVPPVTRAMLARDAPIGMMLDIICKSDSAPMAAFVGAGGAGKSSAAAMLARRERTLGAFPDGIFWISLGQTPDIARLQMVWLSHVSGRSASFTSVEVATASLRSFFAAKRALLIIDDVWTGSDLAAFSVAGPECRTLITTRDRALANGGALVDLKALNEEASVELLALRCGEHEESIDTLKIVASAVGGLPLALELAAFQLRSGLPAAELIEALADEVELIRSLELPGLEHERDPEVAKNRSLDACLNLSVRRMAEPLVAQFALLSLFRPDSTFSVAAVARACDLSLRQAGAGLRELWAMSLVEQAGSAQVPQYRLHSVIRAKARMVLDDRTKQGLSPSVQLAQRLYLERSNPQFPFGWNDIDDDGHLIDHLTYYLVSIGAIDALLWLVTAQDADLRAASIWHGFRCARGQEELFGTELQAAFDYFATRAPLESDAFSGLVQAHLILASLADMNREIDKALCLALIDSELWTHGQAAAHAQRRFTPGEMAATALHLAEPFRTETLKAAIRVATSQPDATMAAQLVFAAEAFDGTDREELASLAVSMMNQMLAAPAPSRHPAFSRMEMMRVALGLEQRLPKVAPSALQINSWLSVFLSAYEGALSVERGELIYADREVGHDSAPTLETLLTIASRSDGDIAMRARAAAERIADDLLQFTPAHALYRWRLGALRGDSAHLQRTRAHEALLANDTTQPELNMPLDKREGFGGGAQLLVKAYAADHEFLAAIKVEARPSRLLLAFIAEALNQPDPTPIIAWLERAYPNSAGTFLTRGGIAPPGAGPFHLNGVQVELIAAIAKTSAVAPALRWDVLWPEMARVSSDLDRLRLIRILLPHIANVEVDGARRLCESFAHLSSAAEAWLALGTAVRESDRVGFLQRAVPLLLESDPAQALGALSKYIDRYAPTQALELARSASAVAAGIGDIDAMRQAFARGSICYNLDLRQKRLEADFWFWRDTMPTHAPLAPLERGRAPIERRFWEVNEDGESIVRPLLTDSDFHDFAIAALSKPPSGVRARAKIADEFADLAQEFMLRGNRRQSIVLVDAIFRVAQMFR